MQDHDVITNQTDFSGSQPMRQRPEAITTPPPFSENDQNQRPWYKTKKVFLAVIPGLLLLLILVVALIPRKEQLPDSMEPTPTPAVEQTNDPMLLRTQRLQAELQEADPSKTDILFPPIDMELELDPADD